MVVVLLLLLLPPIRLPQNGSLGVDGWLSGGRLSGGVDRGRVGGGDGGVVVLDG